MRERPALATPFTPDGPYLVAIHGVLCDLVDLLEDRLPRRVAEDSGAGPARVSEPAPAGPSKPAIPVSEPAPDNPPDDEPEPVSEPAPDLPATPDLPEPPPRGGPGSSLPAWLAWAGLAGVAVTSDMTRDQIIDACITAGVLSV